MSCQFDEALLSSVSEEAALFLKALLTVEPKSRASASSALQLSWLKNKVPPDSFLGFDSFASSKSEGPSHLLESDTE
jgi:serine/threonine protein kinase